MDYWTRYSKVFGAGLRKSTREQAIGALLALAIVIYQNHYGLFTKAQISDAYWSIAWPYLILVGGLLLWHLIKTPAEMDAVVTAELADSKFREESLAAKLHGIEGAKPCIIVRDVYTDQVSVNENGFQVCIANVLRARLENAPLHNYPNNEAKNVTATISQVGF